jgi:hypothetical protein
METDHTYRPINSASGNWRNRQNDFAQTWRSHDIKSKVGKKLQPMYIEQNPNDTAKLLDKEVRFSGLMPNQGWRIEEAQIAT